jgi:hypothetical protein
VNDWTMDELGRSNSSPLYLECVEEVRSQILNARIGSDPAGLARSIVSSLAHRYGLGVSHDPCESASSPGKEQT